MIDVTLYQVTLGSTYNSSANEDEFLKEQQKYKDLGFELTKYNPDSTYQYMVENASSIVVLNKDQLVAYTIAGISMTDIKEIVTSVDVAEYLPKLADKNMPVGVANHNEYNTLCEVHMPGQALSMYNDMKLLEDSCSDVLQEALNEGWRIVAACPQPNQRRPDYILGRFDPRHNGEKYAKR